jgi:hypothetical protein
MKPTGDKQTDGQGSPSAVENSVSRPKSYRLEVLGLFQSDAADIAAARVRSQFIHRGGNIRSAGDEVERAVRSYFEQRLPRGFSVHHGHFLDATLALTPQLDIIIADGERFPVFFRGQDGMEYLPYEGVYAFGEVKSSITNPDVREFIARTSDIRTRLFRAAVPEGYVDSFQADENGAVLYQPWPERGDVYRFIFAVTSEHLDIEACLRDLCDADLRDTPNQICLLDRGVVMSARAQRPNGEIVETYIHPQKKRPHRAPEQLDGWVMATPNSEYKEGATLFYSYNQLLEHLKNNVLLPTDYLAYIRQIVTVNTHFIFRQDQQ